MMTTFNAMLGPWLRTRIIGVLLLAAALAGCNALKLSYSQGPTLLYWWLDGYVDVSDDQASQARQLIGQFFRWHRGNQLPEYIALLQRAQAQALEPTTPAAICAWVVEGRQRADIALRQAVPAVADFVRTLEPEQVQHLEHKFRRTNKDFRNDNLQPDRAERQKAAFKRVHDRAVLVYGRLDGAQRDWLLKGVAASPFDPERWYAERLARQHDIVQTLRTLVASPQMPPAQAQATIAALGERLLRSPRADYVQYQERLAEYNCALVAQLHNDASPAQRRHAHDKFKGWEDDLRSLLDH